MLEAAKFVLDDEGPLDDVDDQRRTRSVSAAREDDDIVVLPGGVESFEPSLDVPPRHQVAGPDPEVGEHDGHGLPHIAAHNDGIDLHEGEATRLLS